MDTISLLLVEDSPSHRALLTESLSVGTPRIKVTPASNQGEFLKALETGPFDCLVLDYYVADVDGATLLKALRKKNPNCPVIIISSSAEQDIVIQSLREGAFDFVPKMDAIVGDLLRSRVIAAVEHRRAVERDRRRAERRQKMLARQSERDPLTGLNNRRFLLRTTQRTNRSPRDRRAAGALLMIDVDHFKSVNDIGGHNFGDEVLRRVAQTIRVVAGPDCMPCRWGGEEFVLAAPGHDMADGLCLAERIRRAVESLKLKRQPASSVDGKENENDGSIVTVSIGVSAHSDQGTCEFDLREHVGHADRAMYLAKRLGRNRSATTDMLHIEDILSKYTGGPLDMALQSYRRFLEELGGLPR